MTDNFEDHCLLRCDAVYFRRNLSTLFFFTCDIPFCVHDMIKEICISLNRTILDNIVYVTN